MLGLGSSNSRNWLRGGTSAFSRTQASSLHHSFVSPHLSSRYRVLRSVIPPQLQELVPRRVELRLHDLANVRRVLGILGLDGHLVTDCCRNCRKTETKAFEGKQLRLGANGSTEFSTHAPFTFSLSSWTSPFTFRPFLVLAFLLPDPDFAVVTYFLFFPFILTLTIAGLADRSDPAALSPSS